jgi:hypothetical protein
MQIYHLLILNLYISKENFFLGQISEKKYTI